MYYFTSYFDKNYLAQGLALQESLAAHLGTQFTLFVLALDTEVYDFFTKNPITGIEVIALTTLEAYDQELLAVKTNRKNYEYFFTITPCLPLFLLQTYAQIDMITYLDADIYFYQSPKILFDELGKDSVLVIPHHFSQKHKEQEIYGVYNVVFNTFKRTESGLACLKWWREKCIDWCYDYVDDDRFADQKYVDQFPKLFNEVKISTNQGANMAIFNADNLFLSLQKNTYYSNQDPLIFYHFHHLRKFANYCYNPNYWDNSYYQNKILNTLYIGYIKKMQFYERKYQLISNDTQRYKAKFLKGKELRDKLIYGYSLLVYPFYSGAIHLEKYYKIYLRLKHLFIK